MKKPVYDFIGIGLGPFNLGLACLAEPVENLSTLFLEQKSHFAWHPGIMLDDSTLQTSFLSDLVTMADPTNRFSFLNYLMQKGRLYPFYISENYYPSRKEYNDYCNWAVGLLKNIRFMQEVRQIEYDEKYQVYLVSAHDCENETRKIYQAKHLVLGVGMQPYKPDCAHGFNKNIAHTSHYCFEKKKIQCCKSITIIGSGQSAAEVVDDLLNENEKFDYQLYWITRSPRFFPVDLSKITLEMTSPAYADYFYNLEGDQKAKLLGGQKALYKGINYELIEKIYRRLYEDKIKRRHSTRLMSNCELLSMHGSVDNTNIYDLHFRQQEQGRDFSLKSEAVIFGTGYEYCEPAFLKHIQDRIHYLDSGQYNVDRFYSIDGGRREIFVQNAELHSHGFVAPDLGMGSYRNACILNQICGRIVYPIEQKSIFQDFSVPDDFSQEIASDNSRIKRTEA